MVWSDWGNAYSRLERSPMDRFKNKNRLLKSFGQNGLRIYELTDGTATAEEVLARIGLEQDQFALIMEFMISNGMVQGAHGAAPDPFTSAYSPSRPARGPSSPPDYPPNRQILTAGSAPPPSAPTQSPYSPPTASPARPPPSGYGASAPYSAPLSRPPPSARAPAAVSPLDMPAAARISPSANANSPRAPPSGRLPPGYPSAGPAPPAGPLTNLPPVSGRPASPIDASASNLGYRTPPPAPDDGKPGPSHGSDDIPNAAVPSLSPLERIIFDKYGPVGVKVYNLIDGERTAEDILNETGISETKLVEILEFMNEQGIIKLERPARPPPPAPGPSSGGFQLPGNSPPPGVSPMNLGMGGAGAGSLGAGVSRPASRNSDDGVGFKPMVESEEENERGGDTSSFPDVVPVDVPILPARLSLLQRAQMAGMLSMKFGKVGHDLIPHIDGIKDFVELSLETGLSLQDLDIILGELGQANLLTFKQLTRTEIAHRYGDDGLAVFKRFGRDGLIIYQMIGKAKSLREIAKKSHVEPARAVEMIIFIHKVLGLDLPLDRDTILRYLMKAE